MKKEVFRKQDLTKNVETNWIWVFLGFFTQVDVIVNTASKELNLSHGLVSASISKTGGDSIQQECKTKYPDGINFGEIAITGGGNLACKIVCHGALPQWDKGTGDSKNASISFYIYSLFFNLC